MRSIFLAIWLSCLTGYCATVVINPYRFAGSGSTLNTGLIAYWKMNETSGGRVDSDPTTPAHDLSEGGGSITNTAGIIGNAVLFDGTKNLSETDTADLSMGDIDMSAACWVKLTTFTNDATIMGQYTVTGNQRSWRVFLNSSTGKLNFIVSGDGTTTTSQEATSFGPPPTNVFFLIYVFHNSVANTIGISVNDGTVNSSSYTLGLKDSTGLFTIGNDSGSRYLKGAVDEAAIWKKVLAPTELTELYNAGAGKTCCPFAPP